MLQIVTIFIGFLVFVVFFFQDLYAVKFSETMTNNLSVYCIQLYIYDSM